MSNIFDNSWEQAVSLNVTETVCVSVRDMSSIYKGHVVLRTNIHPESGYVIQN